MQSWAGKTIAGVVFRYSAVIQNKDHYNRLQSIIKHAEVDRSGAATELIHTELVLKLKETHSANYSTLEANWGIWANWILKQPRHTDDQLLNQPPPLVTLPPKSTLQTP
ncbi:hypothetical protein BDR26DRAFT_851234 [Obelidium mucronatum]|nr:hypothetical protein BDR26DRAFT_851234 [Obelidium mucronatum]